MIIRHINLVVIFGLLAGLPACSIPLGQGSEAHSNDSNNSINSLFFIKKNNASRFLPSGKIVLSFPLIQDSKQEMNLSYSSGEFNGKSNVYDKNTTNYLTHNGHRDDSLRAEGHAEGTISPTNPEIRYAPIVGYFPLLANFQPADNEIWLELDREKKELSVYKGKEKIKSVAGEGVVAVAPGEYPLQHKQKGALWYAPDEYFEKRRLQVPPRGDNFRYRRGALGPYTLYPTTDFVIHSGPFWSEEIGGLRLPEAELASIFLMIQVGTPVVVK
ncbi:MAG TPA: L,D-transpeptidase [Oligoflexia bacterium]|nr:L,D-transpeptidase [Oligoflexia bacterium]HMP47879.1 L,D-transpeptidase [Oligoflexia bacterium]